MALKKATAKPKASSPPQLQVRQASENSESCVLLYGSLVLKTSKDYERLWELEAKVQDHLDSSPDCSTEDVKRYVAGAWTATNSKATRSGKIATAGAEKRKRKLADIEPITPMSATPLMLRAPSYRHHSAKASFVGV